MSNEQHIQDARSRCQFRDVHIKKVPERTWRRARQNALASGLSFKAYMTWLLDHSQPCDSEAPLVEPQAGPADPSGAQQPGTDFRHRRENLPE